MTVDSIYLNGAQYALNEPIMFRKYTYQRDTNIDLYFSEFVFSSSGSYVMNAKGSLQFQYLCYDFWISTPFDMMINGHQVKMRRAIFDEQINDRELIVLFTDSQYIAFFKQIGISAANSDSIENIEKR